MNRVFALVIALGIPFLLTGAGVWLIATPQWLEFEYGRQAFPAATGFTDEERLTVAVTSTLFLTRESIAERDIAALVHRGAVLYTPDEVQHLVDARSVAQRLLAMALVGGGVVALGVVAAVRNRRRRRTLGLGLEVGGWLTSALALWIALFALLAWRTAFTKFHETLFPQGNWQFAESSGLIRLFPERFWVDSAAALLVMIGVGAAVCIATGRVVRRS